MWKLTKRNDEPLLKLPESGMGYQVIRARINSETQLFIALNAEFLIQPEEMAKLAEEMARLEAWSYEELLVKIPRAERFDRVELAPLTELPLPTGGRGAPAGSLAPTPVLRRATVQHEVFARVSAYPNDRRVGPDGSLAKGTYATTARDMTFVPSGFAAVGRYALPNPTAAIYVYSIVPGADVQIRGGTVRPAFFQAGGGVEVQFLGPTPAGSVLGPYRIPEI